MKRFFKSVTATGAVLVTVLPTIAVADQVGLDEVDSSFLVKFMGAALIVNECDAGYQLDYKGAVRWGHSNGADVGHIASALTAARNLLASAPYDRANIDVGVTAAFMSVGEAMIKKMDEDKIGTCLRFIQAVENDGFLKK